MVTFLNARSLVWDCESVQSRVDLCLDFNVAMSFSGALAADYSNITWGLGFTLIFQRVLITTPPETKF